MTISRKINVYSGTLITVVIVSIIAYFIFMLPSLYVNYVSTQRLDTITEIQHRIAANQLPKEIAAIPLPDKSIQYATLKIPNKDYTVSLSTNYSNSTITLEDAELRQLFDDSRSIIKTVQNMDSQDEMKAYFDTIDFSVYQEKIEQLFSFNNPTLDLFSIENEIFETQTLTWESGSINFHPINENSIIIETQSLNGETLYTNYIAVLLHNDATYITVSSAMTPSLTELLPIILQSLPMILSVSLLFILLAAFIFSKALVTPLKKLTYTTEQMRHQSYDTPLVDTTKVDEISTLALALDQLYNDLNTTLLSLEEKNTELALKNEQQQVFLMSSSHQLKTPVTSSLLLLEGMIAKIGKYADTETYLLEVKKQMLTMREIISEILEVNQTMISVEHYTTVNINEIIGQIIIQNAVQIETKNLSIENHLPELTIQTDPKFFYKIIDNILVNAITYTPENQSIVLKAIPNGIILTNYGVTINEDLLPKIFQPFVRVTSTIKGHGLGLYIVANYAKQLDITIDIRNKVNENAVETILVFPTQKHS